MEREENRQRGRATQKRLMLFLLEAAELSRHHDMGLFLVLSPLSGSALMGSIRIPPPPDTEKSQWMWARAARRQSTVQV